MLCAGIVLSTQNHVDKLNFKIRSHLQTSLISKSKCFNGISVLNFELSFDNIYRVMHFRTTFDTDALQPEMIHFISELWAHQRR